MTDSKTKDNRKCGIVMPISAIDGCTESHWAEVLTIIKESLQDTEFTVELVSDSNEVGIIQKRIVQNIYDNEIVICDVSAKNPNVMFELGMRLAFDKPTIIIKDDRTDYSFDTAPIEHLSYPRDLHYHSIQSFKTKLREKTLATYNASKNPDYTTFLKHFGQFVVANIEEKEVGKEDYILQVISDLKKEVSNLGRIINARQTEDQDYNTLDLYTAAATKKGRLINNIKEFEKWSKAMECLSALQIAKSVDDLTNKNQKDNG